MIKRQYYISGECRDDEGNVISKHWRCFFYKSLFPRDSEVVVKERQAEFADCCDEDPAQVDITCFNRV